MGRTKTYKREDLLEKAMYVFWKKGYVKTSMSDLASATGVDKKCLFREFIDKESFFEEVLALYTAWDFQYFEELFSTEPLGIANIKQFLQGLKTGHSDNGCLLNKSIVQRNLISEKHFEIIQKTMIDLEAKILKNLQAAKKNGELKSTSTPAELAKYIIYVTQGISTMSQYEPREGNVDMVLNAILASL